MDSGEYNILEHGGYYLRDDNPKGFIHKKYNNAGRTKLDNDNIIKTINYIQSSHDIINKEFLEKLLEYISNGVLNHYVLLNYHPETDNLLSLKITKDKKSLVKAILSHNSQCYVYRIILTNAILYRDSVMYFPVYLDFRVRLYTKTSSFSFQASELMKSFVCYKNAKRINESGLKSLKYYAANFFGNAKKSHPFKLSRPEYL